MNYAVYEDVVRSVVLPGRQCTEDCCQPRRRIIDSASLQLRLGIVLEGTLQGMKRRLLELFSIREVKEWLCRV